MNGFEPLSLMPVEPRISTQAAPLSLFRMNNTICIPSHEFRHFTEFGRYDQIKSAERRLDSREEACGDALFCLLFTRPIALFARPSFGIYPPVRRQLQVNRNV